MYHVFITEAAKNGILVIPGGFIGSADDKIVVMFIWLLLQIVNYESLKNNHIKSQMIQSSK